ncbi:amidohydrolase family protein [Rarobacter incanus]|uniref:Imidazolonepropionase-like amidohydrolase n=1 Tax=Rarobacter incanus TaxID=153494 RepID=A0A542SLA9_9MICO|nr:amidohydrolase family protein [Rarobacter incanus]TQK75413.1 imidazolonepropionase-like amidohydrolase [Rarobacter incanus]
MAVLHLTGTIALGDGEEVGQAWVVGDRLTLQRPAGIPDATAAGFFFPGLADAHCHIGLGPGGAVDRAESLQQAIADRSAGVLAIRDAGSPADTRWLDEDTRMPRIIRAGRHLALPKRYLRHYARELASSTQLPQAMADEASRADGWVKLVGDWIDRSMGARADLRPLWGGDDLVAGVDAAHALGARVTVHTFAAATIADLLAASVDCIEHGTGLREADLPVLTQRGIAVTPTMLQIAQFDRIAAQGELKYPVFSAHMRAMHARRYDHVRMLYDAGVALLVGTDAGGTIGHGRIADECSELVRAGIPAQQVVAMASWRTRAFIGAPAVAESARADLVGYDRDPRRDIGVLRSPKYVIAAGTVVGPGPARGA